jgi:hypothetical protein
VKSQRKNPLTTLLERVRFVMRQGVVHALDGAGQPCPPK